MEVLWRYHELKDMHVTQPNNHEYELEECHVQEWLTTINKQTTIFSEFPQPYMLVPLYFLRSSRRITYAWSVSPSFEWIPLRILSEPWEGVVWSRDDRQFHCCLIFLWVQQGLNSTCCSCLESLKKRRKGKHYMPLFWDISQVQKGRK